VTGLLGLMGEDVGLSERAKSVPTWLSICYVLPRSAPRSTMY